MATFNLVINRKKHAVEASPEMPLLWVIRDLLGMTGTKFSCGRGLCGSCTVLLDGEATRSCVTAVEYAEGKSITTIEGLAENKRDPLLQAWILEDVPQCGFCQPGHIMTASSLLAANPKPTDSDIDAAMAMNLCRCGTYPRMKRAIKRAAGQPIRETVGEGNKQ